MALVGVDSTAAGMRAVRDGPGLLRSRVCDAFLDAQDAKVLLQLDSIDVERLADVSEQRLRIGVLRAAGIRTVGQVVRAGADLDDIPDVGPRTVEHLATAAEQVSRAVRRSLRFRIDFTPFDETASRLVQGLHDLESAERLAGPYAVEAGEFLTAYDADRDVIGRWADRWRRLLLGPRSRQRARDALTGLVALAGRARGSGAAESGEAIAAVLERPTAAEIAWADFRDRSAAYYALLDRLVDTGRDTDAERGHVDPELVARVLDQPLDTSLLRASLRGYQEFGARYALAQGRVVIGDEMGLGKTIQALAVAAHLAVGGTCRTLVVCPAGLMSNWRREIEAHTALAGYVLHGEGRAKAAAAWRSSGGVAVTSYASLVAGPQERPDLLIVDEAHYVKNSKAKRSLAVAGLTAVTPRVLLLTGTVLENSVEEFRTLVSYLRPDMAVDAADGAAGPAAFRRAVAPVYLRRNQEDVLVELPELVQTDEWVRLERPGMTAYARAVAAGNFMAIRRAPFLDDPTRAKLERLAEIVAEALDNGRKVVVFSYFRAVLDAVAARLGDQAVGPLTGSVPAAERQGVIDGFARAGRPLALVAQVEVGGVGLNLQAASAVVLCEPQTKPTTEAQAIARVHRMGQVETVQVHRLLADDTVDERLVELLDAKARVFDAYARRSSLAEAAGQAVDVSEADLARRVVADEQARIAGVAYGQRDGLAEDVPTGDENVEDVPTGEASRAGGRIVADATVPGSECSYLVDDRSDGPGRSDDGP